MSVCGPRTARTTDPASAPPGVGVLVVRAATLATLVAWAVLVLLVQIVRWVLTRRGMRPGDLAVAAATRTTERLGPVFVKAGQLLSTRVDLLPRSACRALGRLYDQLPAVPAPAAAEVLPPGLLAAMEGGADGLTVVGTGSIACVYRARLSTGETVAVKVRRPGTGRILVRDLALLHAWAAVLQRLPAFRGAPLVDVMTEIGAAIRQQADFVQEAAALRSLRQNLADMDGVRIPAVIDSWCGPDILVMEYVSGLRRGGTPPAAARTATLRALRAVYHMLFVDGFVHCDLHPGNLYPLPDGSVVIVDAGFSRRLTDAARRGFASFFYHMSRGNGPACADIVLATATSAGRHTDPAGFRAALAQLVEQNSRVAVTDFDLVGFAVRLFGVQRRHGYYADPQFVFPILSLIVLEGTLRDVCPDIDFQIEAVPLVLRGLMR